MAFRCFVALFLVLVFGGVEMARKGGKLFKRSIQDIDNQTYPFGVGVAFSGKSAGTAAAITWTTLSDTDPAYILFATRAGGPYTQYPGYSNQYYESYQHHVVVPDLEPNSRYYYKCGSDIALSQEFSFVTARTAGDSSPFRFAIIGDMGITQSKNTILQLTNLRDVDWYMHVGDISYADDQNTQQFGTYEEVWNQFQIEMENVTANYAYMVCPGNHEASCLVTGSVGCPAALNNFSAFRHRFLMPSDDSGGVQNMWYSFDYGMVHFVMLNSETDYKNSPEGPFTLWNAGPFGDQIGWLKDDLTRANENRKVTPWIIAIAHRPMYSSENPAGEFPPFALKHWRDAVEDILYQNNVDLYISGHVHAYERLYPIYQDTVERTDYNNPRDITPIVIGNAGCMEGHNSFTEKQPNYVAYRNNVDWGYGILEVVNNSTIRFEMRRSDDNTVADEFTLIRYH